MTERGGINGRVNPWVVSAGVGLVVIMVLVAAFVIGLRSESETENATPDVQCSGEPPTAQLEAPGTSLSSSEFEVDFDSSSTGLYTAADLIDEWNDPPWSNGVDEGRVSVVENDQADKVLRVLYPDGEYGAGGSGTQWQRTTRPMEAAYVRYSVRFVDDFDFARGGKLPGLAGGEANTGGRMPTGTDGWSARMMWREEGCAVFYLYHPDQPGEFGEDIDWGVPFEPDRWHAVEHLIAMNEPGQNDGVMLGWFDGQLVSDRRDIRFRDVDALAIDVLYFSTFFGGNSGSWAPDGDQFIEFDQFAVAEVDIGTLETMGVRVAD